VSVAAAVLPAASRAVTGEHVGARAAGRFRWPFQPFVPDGRFRCPPHGRSSTSPWSHRRLSDAVLPSAIGELVALYAAVDRRRWRWLTAPVRIHGTWRVPARVGDVQARP